MSIGILFMYGILPVRLYSLSLLSMRIKYFGIFGNDFVGVFFSDYNKTLIEYSRNTHKELRIRGHKSLLSTIPDDFKETVFRKIGMDYIQAWE
jgi:hypothetical protein